MRVGSADIWDVREVYEKGATDISANMFVVLACQWRLFQCQVHALPTVGSRAPLR